MEPLADRFSELLQIPIVRVAVIMAASLLAAFLVRAILFRFLLRLAARTGSDVDDQVLLALRNPLAYSLILAGAAYALVFLDLADPASYVLLGILKTLAVILWGSAAMRVGSLFLEAMSRYRDRLPWIQPQTLPLLEIAWKILVVGGFLYFLLISWKINPTSWIASAGVVGIAVGFAAKDTLANLFAGIFIVADAPFKIGDFVILDDGLRGEITDIGIRSSRLLTRDDIEVTVPNAVIGNVKIVNETGGPHQKMRVRVKVAAAYGSDVDRVRDILLGCVEGIDHIVANPAPRVRFREFGASGLRFELLAWVEKPLFRGRVLDQLNAAVYQAFSAEGIEIPYSKHDLYVKEMPAGD